MSRRGYSELLKVKLVERVNSGEPITGVAKDAGVSYSALHSWVIKANRGRTSKGNCPRCGAIPSSQRYKERLGYFGQTHDRSEEMNPVDGVICPHCGMGFRVSRLETDGWFIVDWQTEYEYAPRYCPRCGKAVER